MLEEQLCPLHLQAPRLPEAVLQLTDLEGHHTDTQASITFICGENIVHRTLGSIPAKIPSQKPAPSALLP